MKNWLDKYEDGGEVNPYQQMTSYNPMPKQVQRDKYDDGVYGIIKSPMQAYSFEQSYRKAQDPTSTQGQIQLSDTRKVPATQRFNNKVDKEGLTNLIRGAQERGLDPATVLAMSLQETGISRLNPLHDNSQSMEDYDTMERYAKKYPGGISSKTISDESLDNLSKKMQYAKSLGKTQEADILQGWNGYGTIPADRPMYGMQGPIDMSKNPVYGKRVIDLRENVIKKTPEVLDLINGSNKKMKDGGWLSKYAEDGEEVDKHPWVQNNNIVNNFTQQSQTPEGKEYFKMMHDNQRAQQISGRIDYSEIDPITDVLLGAGIGKSILRGLTTKNSKLLQELGDLYGDDIIRQGIADNTFIGAGKLNIKNGKVILTRHAGNVEALTKGGASIDPKELRRLGTEGGDFNTKAVNTSGLSDWNKKKWSAADIGEDYVTGTYKIPIKDMKGLVKDNNITFGGLSEGEFLLSPDVASKYLKEVVSKKGRSITPPSNLPKEIKFKDGGGLQKLGQLTNFTNYKEPTSKGWLNKYK